MEHKLKKTQEALRKEMERNKSLVDEIKADARVYTKTIKELIKDNNTYYNALTGIKVMTIWQFVAWRRK